MLGFEMLWNIRKIVHKGKYNRLFYTPIAQWIAAKDF